MLLLSAIALFCPDRANVTHADVIKLEQVRIFMHCLTWPAVYVFIIIVLLLKQAKVAGMSFV